MGKYSVNSHFFNRTGRIYLLASADIFVYFATNNYYDFEIYWRDIIKDSNNKKLLSSYLNIDVSDYDKEFQWLFYLKLGFFSQERIIDHETCVGAMSKAIDILDTLPQEDGKEMSLVAKNVLASSYIQMEEYDKADAILNNILVTIPSFYNAHPKQFAFLFILANYNKGNLCLMQRKYSDALEYCSRAITIYDKEKEVYFDFMQAQLVSLKGEALYFLGKLSESISECEKAIGLARILVREDSNSIGIFADALAKGFRSFSSAGEIDKAKQVLNEFEQWYEDMGEDKPEQLNRVYSFLLCDSSYWKLYIDGKEEALHVAKKAVDIQKNNISSNIGGNGSYLSVINCYAKILTEVGDFQQALKVVNEGISIKEKNQEAFPEAFEDIICLLKKTKAEILIHTHNNVDAIELLEPVVQKLRDIYKTRGRGELVKLVDSISSLGTAFMQQGEFKNSLCLFEEAEKLLKGEMNLPAWYSLYPNILSNKANVLFCLGFYEKSYEAICNSTKIAVSKFEVQKSFIYTYINIIYRNGTVLYNIAYSLFSQGNFSEAEHFIIEALALFQKIKEIKDETESEMYAKSINLHGCIYHAQGKYEECKEAFTKAADYNSPEACFNLGNLYSNNLDNEDAFGLASSYYLKAIELGYNNAHYSLGELYFKVSSDDELYKEVINHLEIFLESCTDDNLQMKSVYMLACSYVNLEETELDEDTLKKVFSYLEESANYGYIDIIPHLCLYLSDGIGTQINAEKAFYWAKIGAENDDPQSQMVLASFYWYGEGTEKNEEEAKKWYRVSLNNENADDEFKQCVLEGLKEQGIKI